MMIASEKQLQEALRKVAHHPSVGRVSWKLQDTYTTGVPDNIHLVNGLVTWVELKFIHDRHVDKHGRFRLGTRPMQRVKLLEWMMSGGRSGVLVGTAMGTWHFIRGVQIPAVKDKLTHAQLSALAASSGYLDKAGLGRFVRDVLGAAWGTDGSAARLERASGTVYSR